MFATKTLSLFVTTLLLLSAAHAAEQSPIPFPDAYRDGYVLTLWGEKRTDAEVNVILDRVVESGARNLVLPFFGCQSTLTSNDPGFCEQSSREYVFNLAKLARAKGLPVSLLPIVLTPKWEWRGFFDPTDVDLWFKNYGDFIGTLARDAANAGFTEFVVATEMTKLYRRAAHWKKLLRDLRHVFPGPLVITVNHGDEDQEFWAETDAIGVSAYYPLSNRNSPSQPELDAAAREHRDKLLKLSKKWKRPVHITEVGFHNTTDAARTPWMPGETAASDFGLQRKCFEATLKAWGNQRDLVRLNVWAAEDLSLPGAPRMHNVLATPSEPLLKEFFEKRLELRTP